MTAKNQPERTCLGTHTQHPKGKMLRFVAAPDGTVVLDISGKAPGRGAYCLPTQAAFQKMLKTRGLTRKLENCTVPEDLAQQVEAALRKQALKALGLAKKANSLEIGAETLLTQRAKIYGVVLATDMGQDAARKINGLTQPKCQLFTNAELAEALGLPHISVVGLTNGQFWPKFRALNEFLGHAESSANGQTEMGE